MIKTVITTKDEGRQIVVIPDKDELEILSKRTTALIYLDRLQVIVTQVKKGRAEQAGRLLACIGDFLTVNRGAGKLLHEYTDTKWIREQCKDDPVLDVLWESWRELLLEDLRSYVCESYTRILRSKRGNDIKRSKRAEAAAALRAAARQEALEEPEQDQEEPEQEEEHISDADLDDVDLLDFDPETGEILPKTTDESAEEPDDEPVYGPDYKNIDPTDYGYGPDELMDYDPITGEIIPKSQARPRLWLDADARQDAPEAEPDQDEPDGDFNPNQFSDYEAPRPRLAYAAGAEGLDLEDLPLPFN